VAANIKELATGKIPSGDISDLLAFLLAKREEVKDNSKVRDAIDTALQTLLRKGSAVEPNPR